MTNHSIGVRVSRWLAVRSSLALAMAFAVVLASACTSKATQPAASNVPWPDASAVSAASLAQELKTTVDTDKPVVLYMGPPALFAMGHVPGAVSHGPASDPEGVAAIKAWAQALPKTSKLVIYCGCCPLEDCPNVRPAFVALRGMGFTNLRVLVLPNNFTIDWAGTGLPVER
jgi:hypothetical protein